MALIFATLLAMALLVQYVIYRNFFSYITQGLTQLNDQMNDAYLTMKANHKTVCVEFRSLDVLDQMRNELKQLREDNNKLLVLLNKETFPPAHMAPKLKQKTKKSEL